MLNKTPHHITPNSTELEPDLLEAWNNFQCADHLSFYPPARISHNLRINSSMIIRVSSNQGVRRQKS